MIITLPNYDRWKTTATVYEIAYRATGQVVLTLHFDLEGNFVVSEVPRSHDEYHEYIHDDVRDRINDLSQLINRNLAAGEARPYGAKVEYEELAEMEVVEQHGSWV